MAAPTIPFDFDPPSEERAQHLSIVRHDSVEIVSWAPAGVTLTSPIRKDERLPDYTFSPDRQKIEKANSGLVTFHGDRGYSIGTYHEFLVSGEARLRIGFQMGRIEVTFGGATPLMAYLFDGIWEWKFYGGWDRINTVRIVGASDYDEAELAFTNAAIRYNTRFKIMPTLWDMNVDDYVLHSPSIFKDEVNLVSWRVALRTLAKLAIDRFGRKLL